MAVQFKNDWEEILKDEFEKDYYKDLRKKLINEYNHFTVYPDMYDLFNAFHSTAYKDIKVVILGQDPYHEPGQAHGLSFSVMPGAKIPPSLQNIYKELEDDIGCPPVNHGYLKSWADQGVMLLNSTLSVRKSQANSHQSLGWETFTDEVIRLINDKDEPVVFILWGNFARKKKNLITNPKHLILESSHPSPFSARYGFFGSKPFSKTNEFLEANGLKPINWCLPEVVE